MKYKIGTKVLIIEPSEEHSNMHGYPLNVGKIGLIIDYNTKKKGLYPYTIKFEQFGKAQHSYFECELKPIIEIGEQLVFDFMND